jgi:UMF1 family MFS transporter
MSVFETLSADAPGVRRPASSNALVAWALYDWAASPFSTVISTFVFPVYLAKQVIADEKLSTSLWGTAMGIAGLAIAMGGPVLGAVADQSGRRKPWIAGFTVLTALATAMLWFAEPGRQYTMLALVLAVVGTIAFEFAMVFYNAMLPALAEPQRMGRWSGWGWALGYAGGLACLVVILAAPRTTDFIRVGFVLVAFWFLLFSLPLFLLTPDAPRTGKPLGRAVVDGMRQLGSSIRQVRRYMHIVRFLIARMFYIDGLATVFAFGGIYAAESFGMGSGEVIAFGIALNVVGGLGAFCFAWIDDLIGGRNTILLSLLGLALPAAVILFVGSPILFWIFALLLGVFVGPVQAASRSYLARIAPSGLENEVFGLFALSGKATAFLGPLLVALLTRWSGSQRVGMSTVLIFFAAGFLLMLTVPTAKEAKEIAAAGE